MSQSYITVALRKQVELRANFQCEYCLLRADDAFIAHQVDHIIAEQHGGQTEINNLALACIDCNRHKGANIASLDPESSQLTPLFNPRLDNWQTNFSLEGAYIVPLTAIGRATARLLKFNTSQRINTRQALIEIGQYP